MQIETHASSAATLFLAINVFQALEVTPSVLACCVVGGIVLDVCHETSVVGRLFPLVRFARRWGLTIQRRGFTHSLSFMGAAGILLCPLIGIGHWDWYLGFLVSVLQHQILDGLTPEGLLWLTPFSKARFRLSPNPRLTVSNGSQQETVLRWILIALMAILMVINYIGARWMLNYCFADVEAGIEFIHKWQNAHSLKAEFKATHMLTKEPIEGVWDVLGHIDQRIILQSPEGTRWSISDYFDSDVTLRADKIRIHRNGRIKVTSLRLNMEGRALGELADYIQRNTPYRLFAKNLILEEPFLLEQDVILFNPVRGSGRHLTLEFATVHDLDPLRDQVVEKGEILVVYAPGLREAMTLPSAPPKQVCVRVDLDDLSELVVREGDWIQKGDLLARLGDREPLLNLQREAGSNVQAKIEDLKKLNTKTLDYLHAQEHDLKLELQHREADWEDYRAQVQQGRATREDVEQRELQVQALRTDLKKATLQREREQASYDQTLSSLSLELNKIQHTIADLEQHTFLRSTASGRVKRIASAPQGDRFHLRIYIEEQRR